MTQFSQPTKRDWIHTATLLFLYIGLITFFAFILINMFALYGFILWLILVLLGLVLLAGWVNRNFGYRCRNCKHEFEVSLLTNLISPHGMGWKYLKCPSCGKRTRATVIKKEQTRG